MGEGRWRWSDIYQSDERVGDADIPGDCEGWGNHTFSVALLIGGKDLEKERNAVNAMNLLCCTPEIVATHGRDADV